MKLLLEGTEKEIADFVLAIQNRQGLSNNISVQLPVNSDLDYKSQLKNFHRELTKAIKGA